MRTAPVCKLGSGGGTVNKPTARRPLSCPISSQPRYYQRPGPGDCPLRHWQAVGLRHPSTVRISNLVSIEKSLIDRVLGAVRADDLATVAGGLREAFGL
jgi:PemK-like, MazF-like toxin of type II toxin-antitoxin system